MTTAFASDVRAPFTSDQVAALNAWQHCALVHPFTCGHCRDTLGTTDAHGHNERALVATEAGWVCPTCDYTQDWALPMMVGPLPVSPFDRPKPAPRTGGDIVRADIVRADNVTGSPQ